MIPYALFRFTKQGILNSTVTHCSIGNPQQKQQQMLFMEKEQLNMCFTVADNILFLLPIVFDCMHISSHMSKYIMAYQHVVMNYNNPSIA